MKGIKLLCKLLESTGIAIIFFLGVFVPQMEDLSILFLLNIIALHVVGIYYDR